MGGRKSHKKTAQRSKLHEDDRFQSCKSLVDEDQQEPPSPNSPESPVPDNPVRPSTFANLFSRFTGTPTVATQSHTPWQEDDERNDASLVEQAAKSLFGGVGSVWGAAEHQAAASSPKDAGLFSMWSTGGMQPTTALFEPSTADNSGNDNASFSMWVAPHAQQPSSMRNNVVPAEPELLTLGNTISCGVVASGSSTGNVERQEQSDDKQGLQQQTAGLHPDESTAAAAGSGQPSKPEFARTSVAERVKAFTSPQRAVNTPAGATEAAPPNACPDATLQRQAGSCRASPQPQRRQKQTSSKVQQIKQQLQPVANVSPAANAKQHKMKAVTSCKHNQSAGVVAASKAMSLSVLRDSSTVPGKTAAEARLVVEQQVVATGVNWQQTVATTAAASPLAAQPAEVHDALSDSDVDLVCEGSGGLLEYRRASTPVTVNPLFRTESTDSFVSAADNLQRGLSSASSVMSSSRLGSVPEQAAVDSVYSIPTSPDAKTAANAGSAADNKQTRRVDARCSAAEWGSSLAAGLQGAAIGPATGKDEPAISKGGGQAVAMQGAHTGSMKDQHSVRAVPVHPRSPPSDTSAKAAWWAGCSTGQNSSAERQQQAWPYDPSPVPAACAPNIVHSSVHRSAAAAAGNHSTQPPPLYPPWVEKGTLMPDSKHSAVPAAAYHGVLHGCNQPFLVAAGPSWSPSPLRAPSPEAHEPPAFSPLSAGAANLAVAEGDKDARHSMQQLTLLAERDRQLLAAALAEDQNWAPPSSPPSRWENVWGRTAMRGSWSSAGSRSYGGDVHANPQRHGYTGTHQYTQPGHSHNRLRLSAPTYAARVDDPLPGLQHTGHDSTLWPTTWFAAEGGAQQAGPLGGGAVHLSMQALHTSQQPSMHSSDGGHAMPLPSRSPAKDDEDHRPQAIAPPIPNMFGNW